ncbi:IS607 family transposase [Thermococcus sp. M39]|uniref:IS607 family transposase n=1 Tax=unclassified Thermococcus TaxID=2627626 RepID=UPI001439D75E|nr:MULTISPECIES: IS607 family transposase [unclassified Thermococcus]NJE09294.1 IS607 family transposase [Thermococcus sp. M39]NJE11970.1 IS607 family transposase [Thermococcus sp. LS2]
MVVKEKLYTVKQASEILGVHPKTIQKWDREGKIKTVRTPGGRRRIPESEIKRLLGETSNNGLIIGYARVSSHTQKDDLERQIETIKQYAKERGWEVQILKDIGSGLNENRKNYRKLLELVAKGEVSKVIITYPDRLTRFGFKTLEFFFQQNGTEIIVLNEKDKTPKEELIEDLITIISHFAGKLYGARSHKYKKLKEGVKKLIEEVEE